MLRGWAPKEFVLSDDVSIGECNATILDWKNARADRDPRTVVVLTLVYHNEKLVILCSISIVAQLVTDVLTHVEIIIIRQDLVSSTY